MNTIHNLSLEPTIYDTRGIHNLFTWKTEMNFLKCLHLFYNPMHLFSGNHTKFGSIFQLLKEECEKQTHFLFFFFISCFYILRYKSMANKWKWLLICRQDTVLYKTNIYLEIEKERKRKKPYDNKQTISIFPFICSNIPAQPAYEVYILELVVPITISLK